VIHGFIPGTSVMLTSSPWPGGGIDRTGRTLGPLVARDADIGRFDEWLPKSEWLTLVEPGVDGRHVVIGRVVGGRALLFLHDASNGKIIGELPRAGPRAAKEGDLPPDVHVQFAGFRADGQRVVYADRVGDEEWLRVWDVDTKREVAALPDAGPPVAWSPDGQSMAYVAGRQEPAVGLWELNSRRTRKLGWSPFGNRRPTRIHFSPDGQSVVCLLQQRRHRFASPSDNELVVWDVTSARQTFRDYAEWAAFPAGVSWFATQDRDGTGLPFIQRRDYGTGEELDRVVISEITAVLWGGSSPDGGQVLGNVIMVNPVLDFLRLHVLKRAIEPNFRPALWETGSGRQRYVLPMALESDLSRPSSHAWSADGTLLTFAAKDELSVWDIPPRRSLKWFMAAAAVFALGLRWIVRRRVRRLRRKAAA
jgi:hypothetical protein